LAGSRELRTAVMNIVVHMTAVQVVPSPLTDSFSNISYMAIFAEIIENECVIEAPVRQRFIRRSSIVYMPDMAEGLSK